MISFIDLWMFFSFYKDLLSDIWCYIGLCDIPVFGYACSVTFGLTVFAGQAVCQDTGMRSIDLWSSSPTGLSGTVSKVLPLSSPAVPAVSSHARLLRFYEIFLP